MLARAEDIGKIVHELGTCDVRHAAGYEAILRRVSRSEGSSIPSLLIGLVNDLAHVWHAGRHRFPARFRVRAFLLSRHAVPSFKQGPQ